MVSFTPSAAFAADAASKGEKLTGDDEDADAMDFLAAKARQQ